MRSDFSKLRPLVVCSILETGPEETATRMDAVPDGCGLVEIRADRLRGSHLAGLIRRAARPVLVSVRRHEEGGLFQGSEDQRRSLLESALAGGADLVDVEWNSALAEMASGEQAARIVLSHHGAPCRLDALDPLYRAMAGTRAARLKIVPRARRVGEAAAIRRILEVASGEGRALACFAMGAAGIPTRILCPSWGSWATYGAAVAGRETAEGQITVRELLEGYKVLRIGPGTRRFALVGRPVGESPSPAMHHAAYDAMGIDACYMPVETDDLDEVVPLVGEEGLFGLEGLGVTIPLKQAAAARSAPADPVAAECGAVNTVLARKGEGWKGYNTDGPAALALIREHMDPSGARVAILGAGGTARAVAAVLKRSGAEVVVYNRTVARARELASALGLRAAGLDELRGAAWDLLVQATPLGRRGEAAVPGRLPDGRMVLDAVYGPRPTPLIREARRRGMVGVDGFDLLVAQAVLQCERMTGERPPEEVMARAGRRWLGEEGPTQG